MENARSIVSLQELTIEILTIIIEKVCKASSTDYCNARATCTKMKEASKDPRVLYSLCLSPLIKKALRALAHMEFLNTCLEHENFAAFFLQGILVYFIDDDPLNEMTYLELGAIGEGDHLILEAAYLYGVLRYLHGELVRQFEELALARWRGQEDLETANKVWKNLRKSLHGITVRHKPVYWHSLLNMKPPQSCHCLDLEIACPDCFMYKRCFKFFKMY